MDSIILKTKLTAPVFGGDIVARTELIERLQNWPSKRLTLVTGPAGYGKSILISDWLTRCDTPNAWFSIEQDDNDLGLFLKYLIASIQTALPNTSFHLHDLLEGGSLPPVVTLAKVLAQDLERVPHRFILVLDDYHLITEKSIHDLFHQLFRHGPTSIHLVLVGRQDPFLPLATLRARNEINEIRIRDLQFSVQETRTFLERTLKQKVVWETAEALKNKTEGWIAGLQLVAYAFRADGIAGNLVDDKLWNYQYVRQYLFSEVLDHLPKEIRTAIEVIAILDRFTPPLCRAVWAVALDSPLTEQSSWDIVKYLYQQNMFVIPLDNQGHWFRYHHLFQQLLKDQLERHLNSDKMTTIYKAASGWLAENGFPEKAIRYALKAGDMSLATRLVEVNRHALLNDNRWPDLGRWLSLLPDSVIQTNPALATSQAMVHYFNSKLALIPPLVEAAEYLLHDHPDKQLLYGEVCLLKGILAYWQGLPASSMDSIEEALKSIPDDQHMVRGLIEIYYGAAGQMNGQLNKIVPFLSERLRRETLSPLRRMRVLFALVWVHILSGDAQVALFFNQQLLDLTTRNHLQNFNAWGIYAKGVICFVRNELPTAIDCLSSAAENGLTLFKRAHVDCMATLVMAYQATKQVDKARETLERLLDYVHVLHEPSLLEVALSCQARFKLMNETVKCIPSPPCLCHSAAIQVPAFYQEVPTITHCRILIKEGSDSSLHEAEEKLSSLLAMVQAQHNIIQTIKLKSLQAVLQEKLDNRDTALSVLEEALTLAMNGSWSRPFIELGSPMFKLLRLLKEKGRLICVENLFFDVLCETLSAEKKYAHEVSAPLLADAVNWREVLTNREYDILVLLELRMRDKEIATQLCISNETVKTHLKNIYKKLGVRHRREAIVTAKRFGFLCPS